MNIILVGAQGSGKGTQATNLAQALGICHIASGTLFRSALEEQTESGLKAKEYLDRGELVPDEITVSMVLERIAQPDCIRGVLLDGFPRTIAQAQALEKNLNDIKQQIDKVIYLKVPRAELLKRLSGRYICRAHEHIYNSNTRPPKIPGICDIDGSDLYQRADDQGQAIQKRLDIFFNGTIHLLNYYKKQQQLVTVDGYQEIAQVHQDLLNVIQGPVSVEGTTKISAWQIPHSSDGLPSQLG